MKQTIRLFSLKPDQYPDIYADFEEYESIKQVLESATSGEFFYAKPSAPVMIHYARKGELIDPHQRMGMNGKVYATGREKTEIKNDYATIKIQVVDVHGDPMIGDDGLPIIKDVSTRLLVVTDKTGRQWLETEFEVRSKYNLGVIPLSYGDKIIMPTDKTPTRFKPITKSIVLNDGGQRCYITKGGAISIDPKNTHPVTDETLRATFAVTNNRGLTD